MDFDRYRVKTAVRAILHSVRPRPWTAALAYRLLSLVLPLLLVLVPLVFFLFSWMEVLPLSPVEGYRLSSSVNLILPALCLVLYGILFFFRAGYFRYCLKLWRGEAGNLGDLFSGFSRFPSLLALLLLVLLFSLLWLLPGFLALGGLLALLPDLADNSGFLLLLELVFWAYCLNRTLRYALALPLLTDHPEYSAWQALGESKRLMRGRRGRLFLLRLSFWGWKILAFFLGYFGGALVYMLLMAPLISRFSSLSQPFSPAIATLMVLSLLGAMLLVSAPMTLWLTGYTQISFAGFYDWAQGRSPVPPPPPWQPSADGYPSRPPEPWTLPEEK